MVILLTFVTLLIVLGFAVYDLRQTEKALRDHRHSAMTTPTRNPDIHL